MYTYIYNYINTVYPVFPQVIHIALSEIRTFSQKLCDGQLIRHLTLRGVIPFPYWKYKRNVMEMSWEYVHILKYTH